MEQSEIDKANAAKEKLRKALEGDNIDEIRQAKDELSKIVQELSVKLYQQAQQKTAEAGSGQSENKQRDNVVDAEFEDLDQDKKE